MVALSAIVWLVMSSAPVLAACAFGCEPALDAFSFRTEYLWPGQTETWDIETFVDKTVAGPEDGPFFAYLVEPHRRVARVPRIGGGHLLGTIETSASSDPSSFGASVTISVPQSTPLGSYSVEVCDDPCTTRLGYIGPTSVRVVSGDIEARLNERIDALSQKVRTLQASIRGDAARAARKSTKLRAEMSQLEENLDLRVSELALRVTELEERLASQEEPAERKDVSQSALAGGLVVFLLYAWLIRERRRKPL